jgi:muramoyltetrapeptide carboxypeptidase
LDTVRGIVFGDMGQCVGPDDMELLEAAILHALQDFDGPIAIGLRSGHVSAPNITLPLNAGVKLDLSDSENPELRFDVGGNGQ